MPTDDTDYIATIYTLHNLLRQSYMGLITYHIMPLVIYSLAADTHTHTTCIPMIRIESILRNQVHAGIWLMRLWFEN